ncbi:inositol monophosphatase family protein [Paludisphaera rhizosphaerae]|uniref:inositol monophosphatase family protein n=1 Tax=Paludisphaera rhizosphaerae TaxID=2711216 RepID=UPI0013ED7825|nr:inositol monophosphatase family protein [Paludisphaera rhizosphaerae]
MDRWKAELETALAAAKVGGGIAAGYFEAGLAADVKNAEGEGSFNIVTKADVEAERAIVDVIKRAFPGHAIYGEEGQGDVEGAAAVLSSEDVWIIDPVDGTSNFFHGVPHFGISVAYYHKGEATVGVVGSPLHDDWYSAVRGGGAWRKGKRAKVSPTARLDESLVAFGYFYDRGAMMEATLDACREILHRKSHGLRRLGAATLDLGLVGTGAFGAFFEYELAPWDFAAGRLFVEEAGGRVTTCHGDPLPLAKTSVLASNGLLHDELVEIMNESFKKP